MCNKYKSTTTMEQNKVLQLLTGDVVVRVDARVDHGRHPAQHQQHVQRLLRAVDLAAEDAHVDERRQHKALQRIRKPTNGTQHCAEIRRAHRHHHCGQHQKSADGIAHGGMRVALGLGVQETVRQRLFNKHYPISNLPEHSAFNVLSGGHQQQDVAQHDHQRHRDAHHAPAHVVTTRKKKVKETLHLMAPGLRFRITF